MSLSKQALKEISLLSTDFKYYAETCLRIRTKAGAIVPFKFNRDQLFLHNEIENQIRRTGKARKIILKARQKGCSTYVEGRYYWNTTRQPGVKAFILTHEEAATKNLFTMAKRYHANVPDALRVSTGKSNAQELVFDRLDSAYGLGTANNKGVGRSDTIQFFHGSEVAFWAHTREHKKGVLQAISDAQGTESIYESTANGLGNYFHEQWQLAEQGLSDFEGIFLPWFWSPEYSKQAPDDFEPTSEEIDLIDAYDVTFDQLHWRRGKIAGFTSDGEDGAIAFKQEYPSTPQEAFQTTGIDSLIKTETVVRARSTECERNGVVLIGVDPARFGNDRTSIIKRRSRVAYDLESHRKKDTMEVAGIVHRLIKENKRGNTGVRVFVDVVGLGAGVVDRLREMGHGDVITPVNGGEKALDPDRYYNKRAEMWGEMRDWLKDLPCQIPDSDSLHADLCAPSYKYDSKSRMQLEKKEDMKKRGIMSPDEGDALALTFAEPVGADDFFSRDLELDRDRFLR